MKMLRKYPIAATLFFYDLVKGIALILWNWFTDDSTLFHASVCLNFAVVIWAIMIYSDTMMGGGNGGNGKRQKKGA